MADRDAAGTVVVAGLQHDLINKRSLVTLAWEGVGDKRLVLDVPFGCTLADLPAAADAALQAFAAELATTSVEQAR